MTTTLAYLGVPPYEPPTTVKFRVTIEGRYFSRTSTIKDVVAFAYNRAGIDERVHIEDEKGNPVAGFTKRQPT